MLINSYLILMRILILCRENACRSQMAEAYLKYYAPRGVEIVSAGLASTGVHPITIKVMEEDAIDISQHHSKSHLQFRNQTFDYLITVCNETVQRLPKRIRYIKHIHFDIQDPAGSNLPQQQELELFRDTRESIKTNMLKFIGKNLVESPKAA